MRIIRWLYNLIRGKPWFRSAKSDNFEEEYFNRLLLPESKIEEDRRNAGE